MYNVMITFLFVSSLIWLYPALYFCVYVVKKLAEINEKLDQINKLLECADDRHWDDQKL